MSKANYYWGVKTGLSTIGRMHFSADHVEVTSNGDLVGWGQVDGERVPVIIIAAGQWSALFGASCADGRPLFIDHWVGEFE